MRRFVPWALVGLVTVVGLAGALVGVANRPSGIVGQPELSQMIAATQYGGTARFEYSALSKSSNPLLRSNSSGSGKIDFRNKKVSTDERHTDRGISQDGDAPPQTTTETDLDDDIQIGRLDYDRQWSLPGPSGPWIKSKAFPVGSFGALGLLEDIGPLSLIAKQVSLSNTTARDFGLETIDGVQTTKYLLITPVCTTRSHLFAPIGPVGPTYVWIDGQGRLVQAKQTLHMSIPKNPFPATTVSFGALAGRLTMVSTIRLFDFGAPVRITAPRLPSADERASTQSVGTSIALPTRHQSCES
jgi:hypothetical protein